MKIIDLLRLKSVRSVLLIASLTGAFFLGKYSGTKPPDEPPPVVSSRSEQGKQEREQLGEKEIPFAEQCQDLLYTIQWCGRPFPRSADRSDTVLLIEPEQKKRVPRSLVLLKPLWKKERKNQRKEERKEPAVALSEKPVQMDFPRMDFSDHPGGDEQPAYTNYNTGYTGGLLPAVQTTVASLEARSIPYGVGPLSDCSGILHRVLMGVKTHCPDYEYPTPEHYRDSRSLARWYYERGELIVIRNASAQSDLIRPGVVLFYGRASVVYKNPSINTLLSPRHGIYHVGIVARVYRDKAGKVAGYELFHGHGRRGRTKASRTEHQRTPIRANYPPFGNGRQQLVAAARIVGPAAKGGIGKVK